MSHDVNLDSLPYWRPFDLLYCCITAALTDAEIKQGLYRARDSNNSALFGSLFTEQIIRKIKAKEQA